MLHANLGPLRPTPRNFQPPLPQQLPVQPQKNPPNQKPPRLPRRRAGSCRSTGDTQCVDAPEHVKKSPSDTGATSKEKTKTNPPRAIHSRGGTAPHDHSCGRPAQRILPPICGVWAVGRWKLKKHRHSGHHFARAEGKYRGISAARRASHWSCGCAVAKRLHGKGGGWRSSQGNSFTPSPVAAIVLAVAPATALRETSPQNKKTNLSRIAGPPAIRSVWTLQRPVHASATVHNPNATMPKLLKNKKLSFPSSKSGVDSPRDCSWRRGCFGDGGQRIFARRWPGEGGVGAGDGKLKTPPCRSQAPLGNASREALLRLPNTPAQSQKNSPISKARPCRDFSSGGRTLSLGQIPLARASPSYCCSSGDTQYVDAPRLALAFAIGLRSAGIGRARVINPATARIQGQRNEDCRFATPPWGLPDEKENVRNRMFPPNPTHRWVWKYAR